MVLARQRTYEYFDRDDINDIGLMKSIFITEAGWSTYIAKEKKINEHYYQYIVFLLLLFLKVYSSESENLSFVSSLAHENNTFKILRFQAVWFVC